MKALVTNNGQVDLISTIEDAPLKKGYVKIQIKQVGLCRTDLLVGSGHIVVPKNFILGHEFSGLVLEDSTNTYFPNQKVAVNPFFGLEGMMGLHFDGCLREVIQVPVEQVIVASDSLTFKQAAYLEPLAASLAVLKACPDKKQRGAVFGKNRIAELTYLILKNEGYEIEWLDEHNCYADNSFDYVIETLFEQPYLDQILHMLRPEGLLIVKSRQYKAVPLSSSLMVTKELHLRCVNYYDFKKTMQWLEDNVHVINHLLGESYPIENWRQAFDIAEKSEKQKIFIHMDEREPN